MANNRYSDRAHKRLTCRFGVEKPDRTGFTMNLSETGVFIKTNNVFKPGTTLQVELPFPEATFAMWGRVIWAKKVPPQLAHVLECGMGICFIDPSAEWLQFYADWQGSR